MTLLYKLDTSHLRHDVMALHYDVESQLSKKLIEVPEGYRHRPIRTEHDVILGWAKFAAGAFKGNRAESDLPCWKGHYEQFGMTMLHLFNLSKRRWNLFHDKVLHQCEDLEHVYAPDTDSGQRLFYRAWFSMIGHPHFMQQGVVGMEIENSAFIRMNLTVAWDDLVHNLIKPRP